MAKVLMRNGKVLQNGTKVLSFNSTVETWVINNTYTAPTSKSIYAEINFRSNLELFCRLKIPASGLAQELTYFFPNEMGYIIVCDSGTWADQAYRTVAFETAPTGDLLTWLQSNAVKQ